MSETIHTQVLAHLITIRLSDFHYYSRDAHIC